MTGKTVIITGANSGIGKETALALAKLDARIIMACRNLKTAQLAKGNYNKVIASRIEICSFESDIIVIWHFKMMTDQEWV
jgi:NAD(P)-dependent dehydrogenase (short-subunit alcohol dehydrogenase family)